MNNSKPESEEPIRSLSDLEQEVSPQFLAAVRKKIYRRTAANQVVAFSWNLPRVILMEMIALLAHLFSSNKKDKPTHDV